MNKWWFKAPIILGSVLMVATFLVFGKVVYAATDSQLGQGLAAILDALEIVVKAIVDLILSI